MITREFIIDKLKKLDFVYGSKFNLTNSNLENHIRLWKEMFEDCEPKYLEKAIDNCIKNCEFPPNIATITRYYREVKEEDNDLEKVVKAQYKILRVTWEEDVDLKTFEALKGLVLHFPEINRIGTLLDFSEKAMSYRNGLRGEGRTDIPTLFEYIQGKR